MALNAGQLSTKFVNRLNFKKMQTKKMSLANIQGKLSRAEMKNIMAGSGISSSCGSVSNCSTGTECTFENGKKGKCGLHTHSTVCGCIGGY